MISLTVENARELLEAGEVYRLGYNCANCGEMFLCFDRIAQCPQSLKDLERIEDEYKNNPQEHHSPVMLAQWILEDGETCEDIREDDVDYNSGPFDDEDEWE